MDKLKQFFKALKLVTPGGNFDLGLIIYEKKPKLPAAIKVIPVKAGAANLEIFKKMHEAIKKGSWLALDLNTVLPSEVYGQLRLLAQANRLQIVHKEKIIELKQPEKCRIIVMGVNQIILDNKKAYPDLMSLFGLVIKI